MRRSLATSVISLFPPGRRFLAGLKDLHNAVEHLQRAVTELQTSRQVVAPEKPYHPRAPEDANERLDQAAAREIQSIAATHLPLLTGDLMLGENDISVSGIVIVPHGCTKDMAFFINGIPFDDVAYPLSDPATEARFALAGGSAAAFRARITRDLAVVKSAAFFRIDASATGTYVPSRWRQAMWFMNPARERFPMPPAVNMQRVIADDNATRFGMGGATIFNNVASCLREMGRDLNEFQTILDWGCGAGRITRYLLSGTDAKVYGADIDGDNIDWCKRNLPGEFLRVPLEPPTSLPDEIFDLIIGGSVITHLTKEMQFAWLREMQRVTRPGGLLFLSIAGPTQFAHQGFPASLYRRVQELGFVDHVHDPALDDFIEDDTYYRSVWHSRPYVMQQWSPYFDILAIEDGIAALQDFVVLRRRSN